MHIPSLTSLIILIPLLPFTSAHPTPLSDSTLSLLSPSLLKRDTRGWIGSHLLPGCVTKGGSKSDGVNKDNTNASENGYVVYDRPTLSKGKCVEWSAATAYIGVNWGSGRMGFERVEFHKSKACSDRPRVVKDRKGGEPGACVTMEGKEWERMFVRAVRAV